MQTGKMRPRGGRRRLSSLILTLALAITTNGNAGSLEGREDWEQGMAGTVPPRHRWPEAEPPAADARRLFVSAAVENPYGIPDLVRSSGACAGRGGRWHARLRWVRLTAPGYAEDLFEAAVGRALAGRRLHLHLVAERERGAASGFPVQSAGRVGGALAIDPCPALTFEAQALAPGGGGPGERSGVHDVRWTLGAGLFVPDVVALAVLDASRDTGPFIRAGLMLDGPEKLCFVCGFRSDTDEIGAGIVRRGRPVVAFSWRMHPVLGTTFAAGIGVVVP